MHRYSNGIRFHGPSRGFSLIELMVSMALGLVVVAGVVAVVVSTQESYRDLTRASQRVENGRFALQILGAEFQHAGFFGDYYDLPAPAALPDPCATGVAELAAAMALPIQGYDAPAASPLACLPAANFLPGTDIVVIRRAQTAATAPVPATGVYLQTRPGAFVLDTGADPAVFGLTEKDGVTPAAIRRFLVAVYFISPCTLTIGVTTCGAGAERVPTLTRLELTEAGRLEAVPVAAGIENLQIDYGIDSDGNGTADNYVTAPADAAAWADVMEVQINLLARNTAPDPDRQDKKIYRLGLAGTVGPFNDRFERHALASAVRVVNLSSRRETP